MTTIDKFAIVWSVAIVVIGVGIAFYASVGGDVTNPTSSNVSSNIDKGTEVIEETLEDAEDVIDKGTEVIEETLEDAEDVIEEVDDALEPSIRGEETGAQTGNPFKDIAEDVKSENNSPITFSVSIPSGTSSPGCETTHECYLPENITIKKGDTVLWSNDDTAAHTVTGGNPANGPSGLFDSSLIIGGETYEFIFEESGSYDYFCMVHPWMVGSVTTLE